MQYEPSLSLRCVVAQHFDFFGTGADGFGGSWSLTRESLRDGELCDQEHAKSDHCESLHGSALPVFVAITKRLLNYIPQHLGSNPACISREKKSFLLQ